MLFRKADGTYVEIRRDAFTTDDAYYRAIRKVATALPKSSRTNAK